MNDSAAPRAGKEHEAQHEEGGEEKVDYERLEGSAADVFEGGRIVLFGRSRSAETGLLQPAEVDTIGSSESSHAKEGYQGEDEARSSSRKHGNEESATGFAEQQDARDGGGRETQAGNDKDQTKGEGFVFHNSSG